MKNNIIVDLDGTLANIEHRLYLIGQKNPDWRGFFEACTDDLPIIEVITIVEILARSDLCSRKNIFILSGREETVRALTERWLEKHLKCEYVLAMRGKGDRRPDHLVKKELALELDLKPENVLCVFDDRTSVVEMWRKEGFRCLQVADHNF